MARPVEDFSGKSWARMSERKTESPHDAKWQLVTAVLLPGPAPARQWLTISFLPDWGGPWRKTQGGYTFRNPPLKSRSNRSHSPSRQNTILHTKDHTSLVRWVFFPSRLFTRHSSLFHRSLILLVCSIGSRPVEICKIIIKTFF